MAGIAGRCRATALIESVRSEWKKRDGRPWDEVEHEVAVDTHGQACGTLPFGLLEGFWNGFWVEDENHDGAAAVVLKKVRRWG